MQGKVDGKPWDDDIIAIFQADVDGYLPLFQCLGDLDYSVFLELLQLTFITL